MGTTLFKYVSFTSHSGVDLLWKVDADALMLEDFSTLAKIVASKLVFEAAWGIPNGGIEFANKLNDYRKSSGPILIVDDVLTTGKSMEEARDMFGSKDTIGVVIFSRGKCPDWITPIWQLNEKFI